MKKKNPSQVRASLPPSASGRGHEIDLVAMARHILCVHAGICFSTKFTKKKVNTWAEVAIQTTKIVARNMVNLVNHKLQIKSMQLIKLQKGRKYE
jgi:hypothetical protein